MLRTSVVAIAVVAAFAIAALLWVGLVDGRKRNQENQRLIIFHAGSLSVPLREVSDLFVSRHPDIEVLPEAAGSRDCARKISDLHRECDVLASADYKVVRNLLMPDHANFNIRFALNEMVIAYTDRSRRAKAIDAANWHEVLLEEQVAFGRSDPDRDPCGYRTEMVFQLAEGYYGLGGLARQLRQKHGGKFIRPKETDLLALLEAGEIDYLFIYRSVAWQHGLRFLPLPDEINLRSPRRAAAYRAAVVEITGKEPGQVITRRGEPMIYSVTIPRNAPNPEAAEAWVALLLSPEGQAIFQSAGQPCIVPAEVEGAENLPESLKALCVPAGPEQED